jgi:hypothetical protein
VPSAIPTLWNNTKSGKISSSQKPFVGLVDKAVEIEKEWQNQYLQTSLEYAMEQDPNRQINLGKSLAAIRRNRVGGLIGVAEHLEVQVRSRSDGTPA